MMHRKTGQILKVSPTQMATLRQYPKHSSVLSALGIQLPEDAIMVIGHSGIRILLPRALQTPSEPS
jgi:hypothetical protein